MNLLALLTTTVQAIAVSGTVLSDQDPVLYSDVYLFNQQGQYERVSVDSNGRFSFSEVSGQGFRLLVITPTTSNAIPKYYPDYADYCEAPPIYVDEDQTLSYDLPQGLEISGSVNLGSSPEEGVLLIAVPLDSTVGQMRGAYSEADGFFEIKGLPKDADWNLAIEAEGLPDQWLDGVYDDDASPVLSISEAMDLGDLELLEGIYLGGLVQSGSTVIPNATVTIYSNSQITNTQSDENGEFWVSGLPPGDATAWATMDGYGTTYYPDHDRPTAFVSVPNEGQEFLDLDINAPLASTISIQLLDAYTEEPITGASVLLYNDNRTVGRGEPVDDFGVALVSGLHEGQYNLQYYAENDGYFTDFYRDELGEDIWIEIGDQTDHELTIYLEPSEMLQGIVLDEEDQPVNGFSIILTQEDEVKRDTTESDGSFQAFGLNEDAWTFSPQYHPPCPNDMGYILAPDTPNAIDVSEHQDLVIRVYRDHDQDRMPSFWEEEMGLNPWIDDADGDADQDGVSNLQEYQMGTNPNDPTDQPAAKTTCGCADSKSTLFFPFLFLALGLRRRG